MHPKNRPEFPPNTYIGEYFEFISHLRKFICFIRNLISRSTSSGNNSQQGTPQSIRKLQAHTAPNSLNSSAGCGIGSGGGISSDGMGGPPKKLNTDVGNWNWIARSNINTMEQLLQDERFLNKFFQYFTSYERRTLAQVCTRWRDTLYRSPKFWSGILPALQCRELRLMSNQDRVKLYNSLVRRGFHAICLLGATDEDAIDIVHSFPLASKHIHSLSLRCSSVSDRGLEALLDHLQVSNFISLTFFATRHYNVHRHFHMRIIPFGGFT